MNLWKEIKRFHRWIAIMGMVILIGSEWGGCLKCMFIKPILFYYGSLIVARGFYHTVRWINGRK